MLPELKTGLFKFRFIFLVFLYFRFFLFADQLSKKNNTFDNSFVFPNISDEAVVIVLEILEIPHFHYKIWC